MSAMRIIDAEHTRRLLPFDRLIPALREMFRQGDCTVPLRHVHAIGQGDAQAGTMLLMPAWQDGRRLGVKTVTIFPGNGARGLPGLHSTYTLFDAVTGVPLAVIDGNEITSRRTAAASALAAERLSRPDSRRLLVLGAGRVASVLADAYAAVRPIREVRVWSVNHGRAAALARRLAGAGYVAEAVEDLQAGVQWADIISCATLSRQPLVRGQWLRPGAHLDLIGSFTPAMRESDDDCLRRATVFVDTEEALQKSGDLLEPIKSGAFARERTAATLAQLCRGEHGGRNEADEITLFKSVGTALEDLAAASLVYDGLPAQGD